MAARALEWGDATAERIAFGTQPPEAATSPCDEHADGLPR